MFYCQSLSTIIVTFSVLNAEFVFVVWPHLSSARVESEQGKEELVKLDVFFRAFSGLFIVKKNCSLRAQRDFQTKRVFSWHEEHQRMFFSSQKLTQCCAAVFIRFCFWFWLFHIINYLFEVHSFDVFIWSVGFIWWPSSVIFFYKKNSILWFFNSDSINRY